MSGSLDRLLETAVADGTAPHLQATVIRGGDVVYESTAGPVAPDAVYRIASMTKAVTTVAVMQQVERGHIALDAPVTDYLALDPPRILTGFGREGEPLLVPASRPPTVRELLTHTAGYGYDIWHPLLHQLFTGQGLAPIGPPGAARLTAPMIAEPGSAWHYSIATDFAGRLLEEVTGTDLEQCMRDGIFEPIGMPDTTFDPDPARLARLASVHRRRSSGEIVPVELPPPASSGFRSGGGGLTATRADYVRFLKALLAGGSLDGAPILAAETIDLMSENQTGTLPIGPMESYDPASSARVDLFPGLQTAWGLGFQLNLDPVPERRHAGAMTWAGLYNTHFWIDRSAGIAGLLMTQMLPFVDPRFIGLYAELEREVYRVLT